MFVFWFFVCLKQQIEKVSTQMVGKSRPTDLPLNFFFMKNICLVWKEKRPRSFPRLVSFYFSCLFIFWFTAIFSHKSKKKNCNDCQLLQIIFFYFFSNTISITQAILFSFYLKKAAVKIKIIVGWRKRESHKKWYAYTTFLPKHSTYSSLYTCICTCMYVCMQSMETIIIIMMIILQAGVIMLLIFKFLKENLEQVDFCLASPWFCSTAVCVCGDCLTYLVIKTIHPKNPFPFCWILFLLTYSNLNLNSNLRFERLLIIRRRRVTYFVDNSSKY